MSLLLNTALSGLTAFLLWRLFFWQMRARGCGYCGARRHDMHSKGCPFRKGRR